jgi:UDP-N-acetylglucosamine:LPS N-acetylglucosamine transferase
MTVGLPAILIPFSLAIDDHQTANANVMKKLVLQKLFMKKS